MRPRESEEIEISVDTPTPITRTTRVETVRELKKRKYVVPEQGETAYFM